MNEAELIFTALAELSTRQVTETNNTTGMEENKVAGKIGGSIAKNAKRFCGKSLTFYRSFNTPK
ncbi:hypothetical protein [Rickettsia conorii]|uniref:hypothetical protein n=1 Tax=Rickettsia conorii TaxID=781 RepID=UPI002260951E|nr:hypothetical protein [Rickettsia conorii]UZW38692.1 hypothetical protein OSR38_07160 [Rickettsia conorii subsp. heilongjiangensis]